jgi:hypothetical protein
MNYGVHDIVLLLLKVPNKSSFAVQNERSPKSLGEKGGLDATHRYCSVIKPFSSTHSD